MTEIVRPDFVRDEHLDYLDTLRESGVTNMFGASTYLENRFRLNENEARDILLYWMNSFSELKAIGQIDVTAQAVFEAVSKMKSEDTSILEGEDEDEDWDEDWDE